PWTMFMAADMIVKAVMISLTFASVVTWTILLAKSLQLSLARRRVSVALRRLANAPTLAEAQLALGKQRSVLSDFLGAAIQEVRLSADNIVDSGVKDRVASRLLEITKIEARSVRVGMSVLATIGSTAPFVGLFGTVWGIMNSFIGISKAQTTNLAVVAPGIAEALLATAIGLLAAIPAVIAYNKLSSDAGKIAVRMEGFADEFSAILSRQIDEKVAPKA
ncbi:MAG: tonB-system energizer ExbB, partial [Pseudaminobacter sp.]|nr:tonB-system energizer ExbB [Pseudaminobacter sp.]